MADIVIDMQDFDTGYAERDAEMTGPQWFDLTNFPKAYFTSQDFSKAENGFLARGELQIKNVKRPLDLPFTLTYDEDGKAYMTSEIRLNRLDYNIGTGGWASGDVIGEMVTVKINLVATPLSAL